MVVGGDWSDIAGETCARKKWRGGGLYAYTRGTI